MWRAAVCSVKVTALMKHGDVKEGKAGVLFETTNPFTGQYRMHSVLAKRANNSPENQVPSQPASRLIAHCSVSTPLMQAKYDETIRQYEAWSQKYVGVGSKLLSQHFFEVSIRLD